MLQRDLYRGDVLQVLIIFMYGQDVHRLPVDRRYPRQQHAKFQGRWASLTATKLI
jgi:hypothetical protein